MSKNDSWRPPVSTASDTNHYPTNMSEIGTIASDFSRHPAQVQPDLAREGKPLFDSQRVGLQHSVSAFETRNSQDQTDMKQRANTIPQSHPKGEVAYKKYSEPGISSDSHLNSSRESSRTPSPYHAPGMQMLPLQNISERIEHIDADHVAPWPADLNNRSMTPTFNRPSKGAHRRAKSGDSKASWGQGQSISLDQGLGATRGLSNTNQSLGRSYENIKRDGIGTEMIVSGPERIDSERRSSTGTMFEDSLMYGTVGQQGQMSHFGNVVNAIAPQWTTGGGYFIPSNDLDPTVHSPPSARRGLKGDGIGRSPSGNGSPSFSMTTAPQFPQMPGQASNLAHQMSLSQQQMTQHMMYMEAAHISAQNRLFNDLMKDLEGIKEACSNKEREVYNKEKELNGNDRESIPNEKTISNLKEEVSVLNAELTQMFHELDTLGVPFKGDPQPSSQHDPRYVTPERTTHPPKRPSLPSPSSNISTYHYDRSTSADPIATTGDYVMLTPSGFPAPHPRTSPAERPIRPPITTQPVGPIYEVPIDPRLPPNRRPLEPQPRYDNPPPRYDDVAGAPAQLRLTGIDNTESSSDENEYWNCPKCTFRNYLIHECEACLTPRPVNLNARHL